MALLTRLKSELHPSFIAALFATVLLSACTPAVRAQAPAGYYDPAVGLSGTALHAALHEIIDDHTRFPYTSTATDTWDILEAAHQDPGNANNVRTVYKNASVPKSDHTQGTGWNREHTWPKSYGFPNDGNSSPYTDCHQLMPADWDYNTARSNRPYDTCGGGCTSYPVDGFPADPNFGGGANTAGAWETWSGRRGDVARALFYMAVRYDGGTNLVTGESEPDLRLTDDRGLMNTFSTNTTGVAYMGVLSVLIEWHLADPVDAQEQSRNNTVYSFQGNRNPFIDHPEFVCAIWTCPGVDTTPPAVPSGLAYTGLDCAISLSWNANTEPDFASYTLWRAPNGGTPTVLASGLTATSYLDDTAENTSLYEYSLSALDSFGNESNRSANLLATPAGTTPCGGGGPITGEPWINEIHYDNAGADSGEGFEIAGPAGTDLSGYFVLGYNGSGGAVYALVTLAGTIPDQQGGAGTLWFPLTGMQNGAPDGLALVDPLGTVLEFLSYEGTFTATGDVASGMTSLDIGVAESSATPAGFSLPLLGSGSSSADFTWSPEMTASPGQPNPGQVFVGAGGGPCSIPGPDCNGNGITDPCDIADGTSLDSNGGGVPDECELDFERGDINLDGVIDISDPIRILAGLFEGQTLGCRDAADTNDSGAIDIADVISLLGAIFEGSPAVPAPVICGADPTVDSLDCLTSTCVP
jgi:endonuclease I